MKDKTQLVYTDGAVEVQHWGMSLRRIFACAVAHHDIETRGRVVKLKLRGITIGEIRLKDKHEPSKIRSDHRGQ